MKLSEAIRLGSMLKPQGELHLFDGVKTCALGAAADALGMFGQIYEPARVHDQLFRQYPFLNTEVDSLCPACRSLEFRWLDVITHLNDHHRWSRERIADWIETVEAPLTSIQPVDAIAREVDQPVLVPSR